MDPDNYTILHTDTYPNSGNGNYLRFLDSGDRYIVSGYDDSLRPHYHIYYDGNYSMVAGSSTATGFSVSMKIF